MKKHEWRVVFKRDYHKIFRPNEKPQFREVFQCKKCKTWVTADYSPSWLGDHMPSSFVWIDIQGQPIMTNRFSDCDLEAIRLMLTS